MSFALGSGDKEQDWKQYLITILAVFFTFIATSVLSGILLIILTKGDQQEIQSWLKFAISLLPFAAGLFVLKMCVEQLHKRPFLSVITVRKQFDFKRFFFAAGIWGTMMTVFFVLAIYDGQSIQFQWKPAVQIPLLLVCFLLLPIQTAFEDVLYRGYLFQGLARSTGKPWLGLLILAGLFGWMHIGNPEVARFGYWVLPYYIISGLFMGILAHLDDGLELGMGYHFATNFFGAMIVTNDWQVFQTDALFVNNEPASFGWGDYLTILTLQPAMLYVFYRIYCWKNPRKKLLE